MTDKTTEALKLAEELILESHTLTRKEIEALAAIREALVEPVKQDPVAWRNKDNGSFCTGGFLCKDFDKWTPLYAAPVQQVDLTKTEMLTEAVEAGFMLHTGYGRGMNKMMPVSDSATLIGFSRAVIAAHKEKNK